MVKYSAEYEKLLAVQIVMLAPMAPHFASTLWSGFVSAPGRINLNWDQISWDDNVMNQKWPQVDNDFVFNLYCVVCNNENKFFSVKYLVVSDAPTYYEL